ncbi:hypothetical protein M3G15_12615 [Paenibacillus sp. p3-SID1389]|nr:hypothetical protein [Paenibacillus sp. p3-SID1389]MCT2195984.1 hypothetical protein [Paenibacillus sp. p3-SID1389]
MNVANTLGAWAAGILYTQFGGFGAIGMFSAVSLALSLGIFLFGGVLQRKSEHAGQESPSAS